MQTINERLALLPGLLGYDSPAALAKHCGLDPNTLRKAMQGPSKPSFDVLESLTSRHPKLNAEWLLLGRGASMHDSLAGILGDAVRPLLPTAQEPRATYASPIAELAIIAELRAELAECQKQARLDLKQAQKDFREDLTASSKHWQYTADMLGHTIGELRAEIARLRTENSELRAYASLDPHVNREQPPVEPAPASAPIGFGRAVPQGAEMHASPGGLYEESFLWLPAAETTELTLWVNPREVSQAA